MLLCEVMRNKVHIQPVDMNRQEVCEYMDGIKNTASGKHVPDNVKLQEFKYFLGCIETTMTHLSRCDVRRFGHIAKMVSDFMNPGQEKGFYACVESAFPHQEFCKKRLSQEARKFTEKLERQIEINNEQPVFRL